MRKLQTGSRWRPFLTLFTLIALTLAISSALGGTSAMAITNDEAAVRAVITQHAAAHETGDLAAIEKLWVHDDTATVAEGGEFNYGWNEFRDHHLRPEIEAMKNVKFPLENVKIHVKGNLAWATYSYRMSGEYKGRPFDSAGAATVVLEKRGKDWLIVHEHTSTKRRPAASTTPAAKPERK